ncbi:sensor histidine kinase [Thalassobacillus devorans]|uniref:sensor histidine kinase n=1 Tax=Thalassobacillus devorans TaxID=279813 RepID=UPI00048BD6A4|nr:ATP-binding protein [Thalassobacillus devorans]
MFRTLRARTLTAFIAISLIGVVFISGAFKYAFEDCFSDYLDDKRATEVNRVTSFLENEYAQQGKITGESVVSMLPYQAMTESLFYRIYDSNGELVLDSTDLIREIATLKAEQNNTQNYQDMDYTQETKELTYAGEKIGTIEVNYHRGYERGEFQFKTRINKYIAVSALGIFGLSFGLSFLFSNQLTAGLRRVKDAVQALSNNDMTVRVTRGKLTEEIQQVADAYNVLADRLNSQQVIRKQFTADIAHELRTPITILKTQIEAFQDGIWQPTQERLANTHNELMRLVRMVNDLEKLLEAENPDMTLKHEKLNANQTLGYIYDHFYVDAKQKHLHLDLQVPEKPIYFQGDKDRFWQIMLNLVSNAVRYTPENGTITIKANETEDNVYITVADNGIGIEPEDLPYIFDRFYRAEKSRARKTGGAGIGLAIVKALVQAHHGQINVQSTAGKGTKIIVQLPKDKGTSTT